MVHCTGTKISGSYRKLEEANSQNVFLIPELLILQVQIMKVYPDELTVIFFYTLCVSIMAAIVGIFTETNPSAWKIGLDTALASIVCSVRCTQKLVQNFNICYLF